MPVLQITNLTARVVPVDSAIVVPAGGILIKNITVKQAEETNVKLAHLSAMGVISYSVIKSALVDDRAEFDPISINGGSCKWTCGTGTPLAAVLGLVGDLYSRLDGGANTTLYVKEGNTSTIASSGSTDLVPSAYATHGGLVQVTVGNEGSPTIIDGSLVTITGTTAGVYDGVWAVTVTSPTTIDLRASVYSVNPAAKGACTTPLQVVTAGNHGLTSGDSVTIAGHTTDTAANGTWTVIVINATTFTLVGVVGNGTGGATGTLVYNGTLGTSVLWTAK